MSPWLDERRTRWIELDRQGARWLHRGAAWPWVLFALVVVSRAGNGVLWYAIMVVLPMLDGPHGWYTALQMAGVGLANLLIYLGIKHRIGRPRPFADCPGIRCCTRALDPFGFPSGHTLHAVAFSLLLAHHYPPFAWPLAAFTLLTAASRVVLGLHYPSDVAVGAAIGAVTAEIALYFG